MQNTPKNIFIDWIRGRLTTVERLEADAKLAIGHNNQVQYREYMQAKAELLAALAGDAEPLLAGLPEVESEPIRRRLRAFSASAANSLRIGSVFYMSALLYPDEHKPGEPNDLALWIQEL